MNYEELSESQLAEKEAFKRKFLEETKSKKADFTPKNSTPPPPKSLTLLRESQKSYSSATVLKFLLISIGTGFLAVIFPMLIAVAIRTGENIGITGYLLASAFSIAAGILSIAYVIALGVYIGSNSK